LSEKRGAGSSAQAIAVPGAHSLAEILSQPQFWGRCIEALQRPGSLDLQCQYLHDANELVFIGCGSSYYIALAAAASWKMITGRRAQAIAASELLLYPDLVLAGSLGVAAVAISRSGRTSETVRAAEFLEREKDIRTLAVSGTRNQSLDQVTSSALGLPACDEQSTVMTRSFTAMLLSLQYLAARVAGDDAVIVGLTRLPKLAEAAIGALHLRIREFVTSHHFADYVCLGQGPFYGLACETALKLTEMSLSYAQNFHTLEFRHGPKSIAAPETLLVFLLSEQGYDAECEVLQEMKSLGAATTLTIANRADERARHCSDLLIEFDFDLPELARLAPYVFAGQFAGLYTGLKKGLDPDNPRNLSRVVILEED
jgi:glutamine---fructose-6-phosphate transaminase (isomerizing)